MRPLLFLLLIFVTFVAEAQKPEEPFLLEGKVVNQSEQPISDVYIINMRNQEKVISRPNGVFSMLVLPSDSLAFLHISYTRKIVTVSTLLLIPIVKIESEHVNIDEVEVRSEKITDYDRAQKNLEFIKEFKVPSFEKIDTKGEPVRDIVTQHNRQMRTEASSLHIITFSPSRQIKKATSVLKKKDPWNDYYSTRKVIKPPVDSTKTKDSTETKEKNSSTH